MDSFLFAINAVSPIILTIAVGYLLKKVNLISVSLAKAMNKLVFRIFLPAMLFLNIYNIQDIGAMDPGYIVYSVIAVLVIFALWIPAIVLFEKDNARRGVLLQTSFRSNYALIGIPLAQSLFGDAGAAIATVLSAAAIPLYNVLAVISLTAFRSDGDKPSLKRIVLDVVKNPLIQGIALGLAVLGIRAAFSQVGITFRLTDITPLFTVLHYLSNLATPLALLVLGAQFEFSSVAALKRQIVFGTLIRTVFVPILGIGTACVFFSDVFNGAHFAAFVAMFATPLAVSTVPMVQEMDGDVELAGQLVVWTTLVSAFSVFLISYLLKVGGIF